MSNITKITSIVLSITIVITTAFCSIGLMATAQTVTMGYVNATNVNVREDATTQSASLGKVSNIWTTVLGSKPGEGGYTWYQVSCVINGNAVVGYIREDLIQISITETGGDFEDQLSDFPESYHDSLRRLHSIYPNWSFYADNASLSLDEAVELESQNRRKEVSMNNDGVSWRSMGAGSYDWGTGQWAVDNGGWTGASREVIYYYMDPRNFINEKDIYMFLQQGYNAATQTAEGVNQIVAGTFLANGYSDDGDSSYGGSYVNVLMAAARESGVSPYVLASTIIQEQGASGASALISGDSGYYNFFNIGATGSTTSQVVVNGLNYARSKGWNTRAKAIIEGAKTYSDGYVSIGQDTYYYKNFNILNPDKIWHQYAQAVYDARSSSARVRKIYSSNTNASLTFRIPVYTSLPGAVSPYVTEDGRRNNYYFTSISVSGLTPSFSMYTYSYDLYVSGTTTVCVTMPDGAALASATSHALSPGQNRIVLTVKSETGFTNNYIINVNSAASATLYISTDGTIVGPDPTPPPVDPPVNNVMCGDTNSDGRISLIDLANVQKHLLGIRILTGDGFTGGDTNYDGKISLIDLANIQKHLLGVKLLGQ